MQEWNLYQVYNNIEQWNKDFEILSSKIEDVIQYKGRLNTKEGIEQYYIFEEEVSKLIDKLYSYAQMSFDKDQKNLKYQELVGKVINVIVKYQSLTSYVKDEILKESYDLYESFAKDSLKIKEYLFIIKRIFDSKEHILPPQCEKILTNYSLVTNSFSNLYSALQNSDFTSLEITLSTGEKVNVSANNYTSILARLKNQEDRKKVFETQFSYYEKHKNTLALIYKGVVDSNIALMKSKGYNTFLDAYLEDEHIPSSVYTSLIETARENTAPLKRYIKLRKKYFNLDEYHTYDRMLSFSDAKVQYPYDKAYNDVLESLSCMPKDFQEHAKIALEEGRVDVKPTSNKRSGAYSSHIEGFGPFILLNHTDDLESAFTLAHECGHSIHTLYSTENQPYATKDYRIFVAEIPSTLNEQLFLDYLLKNSTDKSLKLQAVCKAIDNIVSTFYRQTLFADFEYQAHTCALNGEEINYEKLSSIMKELYNDYYGIDLDTEPLKKLVWAYIPHLYFSPFYVYQYATCFSASMKIYEDIKSGKESSLDKYLNMLKAGCSLYPVDVVKLSGVDLTKKDTFISVCNKLDSLIDELEELIK